MPIMNHKTTQTTHAAAKTERYLCVRLQSEQYAIPILKVQEIKAYTAPTPVPRLPAYARGVLNQHGAIVPVIDLRMRLGLPEAPYGPTTVTVFLSIGERLLGVIVDAATRVLDIKTEDVGPSPELGAGIEASFIAGLARSDTGLIVLLATEALFGAALTLPQSRAEGVAR